LLQKLGLTINMRQTEFHSKKVIFFKIHFPRNETRGAKNINFFFSILVRNPVLFLPVLSGFSACSASRVSDFRRAIDEPHLDRFGRAKTLRCDKGFRQKQAACGIFSFLIPPFLPAIAQHR